MAARITFRTSFFTNFCTPQAEKVPAIRDLEANPGRKAAAEKSPNRAGATPLFGLSAAQKVFGVAPALRHLVSVPVVSPRCRKRIFRVGS